MERLLVKLIAGGKAQSLHALAGELRVAGRVVAELIGMRVTLTVDFDCQ